MQLNEKFDYYAWLKMFGTRQQIALYESQKWWEENWGKLQ